MSYGIKLNFKLIYMLVCVCVCKHHRNDKLKFETL